jgi:hypothetical protein
MLIHGSDKERAFDLAVQRSFPYLIFPPIHDSYEGLDYDEFRNKLINNLVALNTYKNSNDDVTFYKQNEEIRNTLESSVFDRTTSAEIESYKYQQMTLDRAIRDIANKITGIEILSKELKNVKNRLFKLENGTQNFINPSNCSVIPNDNGDSKKETDGSIYLSTRIKQLLQSAPYPLSRNEIADKLEVDEERVKSALGGFVVRNKKHLLKTKRSKLVDYKDTIRNIEGKRDFKETLYQWVESLPENEENCYQ